MPEEVRLQIRTNADPKEYSDVGSGGAGIPVPVDIENSVLPVGAATSANQTSQIVLETQLETLIETLQELIQRLAPLASAITQVGGQSLRVTQTAAEHRVFLPGK